MTRTCLRPIPTGKITRNYALVYGLALTVLSVILLNYFTNFLSATLLLFTILFYILVYTIWLKKELPQNIVIGGAAGALPPIIGWTIATNSISLEPISLFLIIFFGHPHILGISLYKAGDYKKSKNSYASCIKMELKKLKIYFFILFIHDPVIYAIFNQLCRIKIFNSINYSDSLLQLHLL